MNASGQSGTQTSNMTAIAISQLLWLPAERMAWPWIASVGPAHSWPSWCTLYCVTGTEQVSRERIARCQQGSQGGFSGVIRSAPRRSGSPGIQVILTAGGTRQLDSRGVFAGLPKYCGLQRRLEVQHLASPSYGQRRAYASPFCKKPSPGYRIGASERAEQGPRSRRRGDDAERIDAFYEVLDRLSEKKRAVFILHEIEGSTPAEIAAILRVPVLTVRTRLFYARREIVSLLQNHRS